jgi:hypothetical protein
MPTKIHIVRHAQGFHNVTVSTTALTNGPKLIGSQRDYTIRDAVLTPKGKEQCRALSSTFKYHQEVDIIFASPLRRTIQTAALSFGPALSRPDVPFVLHPALQEVGDMGSDKGIANSKEDLERLLPELFANDKLGFDIKKIDASGVMEGWNSKVSCRPRHERKQCQGLQLTRPDSARLLGLREAGHLKEGGGLSKLALSTP